MSQLPRITIITPSFNQGHFIGETIESVLQQGYPNLEYWVIDGGSSDNTVDILKSYGDRINWVSEKDRGQTHAINKGLKKATGEIVAYLNSDDVYLPNTLQTVADFFLSHPHANWLTGDYFIINEHGQKMQSFVAQYKRWLRRFPSKWSLSVANYIPQPSTFWRKAVHKKVGYFDEKLRYVMDFEFWMRLFAAGYQVTVSDRHFSLFRIHSQSKGGGQYRKQFAEETQVVQRFITNPVLLSLHWLHTQAIILAYMVIKG